MKNHMNVKDTVLFFSLHYHTQTDTHTLTHHKKCLKHKGSNEH